MEEMVIEKKEAEETEKKEKVEEKEEEEKKEDEERKEEVKWWIVKVKSGKEDFVRDEIKAFIEREGIKDIEDVFVPEYKETIKRKLKGGEREFVKAKKIVPGYVFIKMKYSKSLWDRIRTLSSIYGMVGGVGGSEPKPASEEYIEKIKKAIEEGGIKEQLGLSIGGKVVVKSGPFKGYTGIVESISQDKKRVKIRITIFKRTTSLELDTAIVEPVLK